MLNSNYRKKAEEVFGLLQVELYLGEPYLNTGMTLSIPVLWKIQPKKEDLKASKIDTV